MPLYAVRRELGDVNRDDIDAASLRAIVCAYEYPRLNWVRSFWDRATGTVVCYYEAESAESIWEHSHRSAIPCSEVTEVEEFGPGDYAHIASPALKLAPIEA